MNRVFLITHLIKEELRNKKFMFSFEDMGMECSRFTLNISGTILQLSGFSDLTDEVLDWYHDLIDNALTDIHFHDLEKKADSWAQSICSKLIKKAPLKEPEEL